jgi:ribosomal protein S12 methylthiotransferase accessory factor
MVMEIIMPGGKRVDALYKGFTIRTDQPQNNGGEGTAPSPFDLFLSSIGTCAGYYVLDFCRSRDIPADKVKLLLKTAKDDDSGMIDEVSLEIQLPAEFPEKFKEAVIRAANQCAVKKHINNPPAFDIYAR